MSMFFLTCTVQATKVLDIPLIVTEQYPKGLGSTVPELDINNAVAVFPKTKFSMVLPEVEEKLKSLCSGNVRHVVLFGIETHVCIQQTVIDLLDRTYEVHVVADGCSSRSQMDRLFALQRFQHSGATVTTSEAVLLQLVGDKEHPKFKEIQGLIKTSAPDSGLVANL
ncbi:isochorismatase domain-containing protein 1-like isoform X2 [Gigantopelta aegis]|uniref:isochorismatase domain-containing protein 1-like isoform X2 n=1 Tax=Gigantopelta aegis TaxID=1735272 RepID=UPI001B88ADB9|nr:isochorismatase domain-containing protein 1-like isoform X2 [Gigantopelta aegis]